MSKVILPEVFILDVDGVMTDGCFYYSENGKILKKFGADDSDALKFLSKYIKIEFITSDKRGFKITKKRIQDIGFKVTLIKQKKRIEWIKKKYLLKKVVFMADSFLDSLGLKLAGYSIAPKNADNFCKKNANYVTKRAGGDRAVSEACFHLLKKFFKQNNFKN